MKKRGQVTVFVIVAILIVVAGSLFFLFKDTIGGKTVPASVEPVQQKFIQCLETQVDSGISFLESNGGYIEGPEFEAGTRLNPSSSKLSFGGFEIPYWSYLSGSSLAKEQVPTKEMMENQLSDFIEERILNCDFDEFEERGFVVNMQDPSAEVRVADDYVDVDLELSLSVREGENYNLLNNHELRINSNLGLLYDNAVALYEKQKQEMFLEEYGVDVLRLYLPVDGVELTCSPLVWNAEALYPEFQDALSSNYIALSNKGRSDDYFTLDFSDDVEIGFLYSQNWPTYFEVAPTDGGMMIAEPVGNERGLGILGFCYVPYHYVYDTKYPVLIRVEKDSEVFQFPVVSYIDGNLPREARNANSFASEEVDVCQYDNTQIEVGVYDSRANPINAEISFECFASRCNIGSTENGKLSGMFPQCANGLISVSAEGYRDEEIVYSTLDEGSVNIIMDKEYERRVELDFDGRYSGEGIVSISSDDFSKTIVYPEQNTVDLAAGTYDVNVMIYSDSSIRFPETEKEQCVEVPRSGVLGLAGLKETECTTVVVPEQTLENALVGGGSGVVSISESDLVSSSSLVISGEKLNTPTSLEELQENYILTDVSELEVGLI